MHIWLKALHAIVCIYSQFGFEISCVQYMCTLLVLSRVANFTRPVGISKCRAHASLPFGRTYVHNFLYVYLHWSPNPKCCLAPVKPSGPHILRRRLELNPSPVYCDVAPHAVVLLQTLLPHWSSVFFKRTREKRIVEALSIIKGFVVAVPTLGCPR